MTRLYALGIDHGTPEGDYGARVVVERLPNGHLRIVRTTVTARRREDVRGSTEDRIFIE